MYTPMTDIFLFSDPPHLIETENVATYGLNHTTYMCTFMYDCAFSAMVKRSAAST